MPLALSTIRTAKSLWTYLRLLQLIPVCKQACIGSDILCTNAMPCWQKHICMTYGTVVQKHEVQVTALRKELTDQKDEAKRLTDEAAQLQDKVNQQLRIFKLQQDEERKLKAAAREAQVRFLHQYVTVTLTPSTLIAQGALSLVAD